MVYKFELEYEAKKDLKALPKTIVVRIIKKLVFYFKQEDPLLFADRLINFPFATHRFRVGDYRLLFYIEDSKIIIIHIRHRKEVYKKH